MSFVDVSFSFITKSKQKPGKDDDDAAEKTILLKYVKQITLNVLCHLLVSS